MAGMNHALILVSRIVAGVVAALAFYFAFFLYEDEEGVWQNRIENLWAAVYDRAKITDSTSTALFNKIGETLDKVFNRLFGRRLISFHALAVSVNMSLAGSALQNGWLLAVRKDDSVKDYLSIIALFVICGSLAILAILVRRPWITLIGNLPIIVLILIDAILVPRVILAWKQHIGLNRFDTYTIEPIGLFLSFCADLV
jgi:hypothetical protein